MRSRLLPVLLAGMLLSCKEKAAPEANPLPPLRVAAASDLAFAWKEIGDAFEKQTGRKVLFTFGSTGLLAKQIAEGAPYDIFGAANISFADEVIKQGAAFEDSKAVYGSGRIVMWSKQDLPAPPADLKGLLDERFKKIAIANPEHAPYGRAAQQAFEQAGIWVQLKPKIVYGENISQTLQFAKSGNADVAVVALSLATVTPGNQVPIDAAMHRPIDQAMVVCKRGGQAELARKFMAYVNGAEGRATMRRFGFLLPTETATAANR